MDINKLTNFIAESNYIEGIHRPPTSAEIHGTAEFIALPVVTLPAVQTLVDIYQPGIKIRNQINMNVRVGNHIPPKGGPHIVEQLNALLDDIDKYTPWEIHNQYETLHPFMDGNGRSGRAIWLWQMYDKQGAVPPLGFMHTFYYQTLQESRS